MTEGHKYLSNMTLDLTTLDAHEQPDEKLKAIWKRYSRTDHEDFVSHPDIDELDTTKDDGPFKLAGHIPSERLMSSYKQLEGVDWDEKQTFRDAPFYYHPLLPGMSLSYLRRYLLDSKSPNQA